MDAPQVVGNDSIYGGLPFVYEENPLSQTDVEYAVNAELGGGDDATGGGGTPAAVKGGATTNAPNVDAGSGWKMTALTGVNDLGILIGTGVLASNGTTHAVLLLPLQLSVQNIGSYSHYTPGFKDGGTGSASDFRSQAFQVTAKVQSLPGLSVKLGILQDIQSARTVTYEDGSTTTCQEPAFYADLPANDTQDITTTIDAKGVITSVYQDEPGLPISAKVRPYLSKLQLNANVRDFATLQIGGGTPQVVVEVKWSSQVITTFKPIEMSGDNHFPSIKVGDSFQPSPASGQIIYGVVPLDTPIPDPRTPLSNDYIGNAANWKQNPSAGKFANQHPLPNQ